MISGDCISTIALKEESAEFSALLRNQSVVDVEIPVKGLLVRESVVLSDCSPGQVEAQCSNISHFCTGSFDTPLFIKLHRTNNVLACRLNDMAIHSGKLILSDFRVMDRVWTDRECDRVQPRQSIFVSVINGRQKLRANLFDLSLTGMGILIDQKGIIGQKDQPGSKLIILLRLPNDDKLCKVEGVVRQSRKMPHNLIRLGLDISMSKREQNIVSQYLTERKREILDELFLNFLGLLNYRATKDEYF